MIAGGLMGWKALCLLTNSESPVVVVLSLVLLRQSGNDT
jgi:hypothetical protein